MCARTCLEARVPYLRRAVVDAILAHPRDRLATGTRAKEPLLAAASDILPARIHAWIKTKFSAPGMRWLTRTPLAAQLPELVLGSGHHVRLGLSRAGLETLLAAFTGDPHTHYMPTWVDLHPVLMDRPACRVSA